MTPSLALDSSCYRRARRRRALKTAPPAPARSRCRSFPGATYFTSADAHPAAPSFGGLKWYAPTGRWDLRADYRFQAVASKDDAPAFFGRDTRYGHRVYAAVVVNAVR